MQRCQMHHRIFWFSIEGRETGDDALLKEDHVSFLLFHDLKFSHSQTHTHTHTHTHTLAQSLTHTHSLTCSLHVHVFAPHPHRTQLQVKVSAAVRLCAINILSKVALQRRTLQRANTPVALINSAPGEVMEGLAGEEYGFTEQTSVLAEEQEQMQEQEQEQLQDGGKAAALPTAATPTVSMSSAPLKECVLAFECQNDANHAFLVSFFMNNTILRWEFRRVGKKEYQVLNM